MDAIKSGEKGFFRIEGVVLLDKDRDPDDQKRNLNVVYKDGFVAIAI